MRLLIKYLSCLFVLKNVYVKTVMDKLFLFLINQPSFVIDFVYWFDSMIVQIQHHKHCLSKHECLSFKSESYIFCN